MGNDKHTTKVGELQPPWTDAHTAFILNFAAHCITENGDYEKHVLGDFLGNFKEKTTVATVRKKMEELLSKYGGCTYSEFVKNEGTKYLNPRLIPRGVLDCMQRQRKAWRLRKLPLDTLSIPEEAVETEAASGCDLEPFTIDVLRHAPDGLGRANEDGDKTSKEPAKSATNASATRKALGASTLKQMTKTFGRRTTPQSVDGAPAQINLGFRHIANQKPPAVSARKATTSTSQKRKVTGMSDVGGASSRGSKRQAVEKKDANRTTTEAPDAASSVQNRGIKVNATKAVLIHTEVQARAKTVPIQVQSALPPQVEVHRSLELETTPREAKMSARLDDLTFIVKGLVRDATMNGPGSSELLQIIWRRLERTIHKPGQLQPVTLQDVQAVEADREASGTDSQTCWRPTAQQKRCFPRGSDPGETPKLLGRLTQTLAELSEVLFPSRSLTGARAYRLPHALLRRSGWSYLMDT